MLSPLVNALMPFMDQSTTITARTIAVLAQAHHAKKGRRYSSAICDDLGVSQSGVSMAVKRLEEMGLVKERKGVSGEPIDLTDKGREILEDALQSLVDGGK